MDLEFRGIIYLNLCLDSSFAVDWCGIGLRRGLKIFIGYYFIVGENYHPLVIGEISLAVDSRIRRGCIYIFIANYLYVVSSHWLLFDLLHQLGLEIISRNCGVWFMNYILCGLILIVLDLNSHVI